MESSKLGWLPVDGIVDALTSLGCSSGGAAAAEFCSGRKCEVFSVLLKDFKLKLEHMEDLGSVIELPRDGSCGAGSGGVDGARGYVSSPSIPVHTLV